MTGKRQELKVDADGRVFVDGIRVASVAWQNGELVLQFNDKNKYRSVERGTHKLGIAFSELLKAVKQTNTVD